MTFHFFLLPLLFCLLLSLARLCYLSWCHHGPAQLRAAARRTSIQRLLKPRTPRDCPACRLACTPSSGVRPAPAPVRPWREVKSRRGAPKRVNTEGFACPNQQCPYSGITDAHIHALVGDGTHGHAERIQTFRCQACHMTFTARRHTPLYRLKTPSCQVAMVLTALAEDWILLPLSGSSATGRPPLPPGCRALASTRRPCMNALLPSPAPTPPVGRTAHQAAQLHTGAVAVAGHRPPHEDSSRPPSGSRTQNMRTSGHPFPATDLGPWLPPALHQ